MAFFKWQPILETGIAKIDSQHRNLVRMINGLHTAMSQGKGKDILGSLIDNLIEYTKTHFSDEEELMQKYDFYAFDKHKEVHQAFVEKVLEFKKRFAEGKVLTTDIMHFLKDWLFQHIAKTDKEYIELFSKKDA